MLKPVQVPPAGAGQATIDVNTPVVVLSVPNWLVLVFRA